MTTERAFFLLFSALGIAYPTALVVDGSLEEWQEGIKNAKVDAEQSRRPNAAETPAPAACPDHR